ncbi:hypothetical protein EXS65_03190 [Candidatus Peribacteria bacterium]|nr:hypothetical protein [Candidatus Peribacteria bacterium]
MLDSLDVAGMLAGISGMLDSLDVAGMLAGIVGMLDTLEVAGMLEDEVGILDTLEVVGMLEDEPIPGGSPIAASDGLKKIKIVAIRMKARKIPTITICFFCFSVAVIRILICV